MALPIFKDDNTNLMLMQNSWSSQLNPVLANPMTDASILTNVSLTTGSNTINHKLGTKLQGWSIVRKRAAADIYDNQDSNQMPTLTLILVSSANVSVDIMVF